MAKFLPFIFLLFVSGMVRAQTWELGGGAGAAGYMGDLNPNNPVKVSGYSISGFAKRNFNGYWSLKINYTYGTIAGADSTSNNQQFRDRNLSFSTTLSEIALLGEFNFMNYIPDAGKNKYTPYLFLGASALNYTPRATYNGKQYNLRELRTEGQPSPYANTTIAAVYGAGFKYNISGKMTIGADIGYRTAKSDYLDDVSGIYPKHVGQSAISQALSDRSGENTGIYLGVPGTQRGDLRPRDTYFFTQITLSYTFVTQKCYFQ